MSTCVHVVYHIGPLPIYCYIQAYCIGLVRLEARGRKRSYLPYDVIHNLDDVKTNNDGVASQCTR